MACEVSEPVLCSNRLFEGLTVDEKSIYDHLRVGTWGARIRLEQERLDRTSSLRTLIDVLNSGMGESRKKSPNRSLGFF